MSSYEKILDTIDLHVLRVIDLPGGGRRRFSVEIHTPPPHKTATVFFTYHGVTYITVNYPLSLVHPEKMREEFVGAISNFLLRKTLKVLEDVFSTPQVFLVHENSTSDIYIFPTKFSHHTVKNLPFNVPSLLFRIKKGSTMRFFGGDEDFSVSFCLCILYKVNLVGEKPLRFLYRVSKGVIPKMEEVFTSLNHEENLLETLNLPPEVKFLRAETHIHGRGRNQPTYHGYLFLRGRYVKVTTFASFSFTIPHHLWEQNFIPYLNGARDDLSMLVDRLLFVHSFVDPPTNEDGDARSRYIKLLLSLKEENDPLKHDKTT